MRREKFSKPISAFFLLFFIWILLQFLVTIVLPSNSIRDLSGFVGIVDNKETIEKISFPFNTVYTCGDLMCHQKAERSFFINGNQMPFCVRCTAIWLGIIIGLGFITFYKIQLDEKFLLVIVVSLTPIGVDGIGQLFGFWESINFIRFITGLLAGSVCGLSAGIIVDEIKEIILYKTKNS